MDGARTVRINLNLLIQETSDSGYCLHKELIHEYEFTRPYRKFRKKV